jgi:flagellar hook-basal body complex protein FliE
MKLESISSTSQNPFPLNALGDKVKVHSTNNLHYTDTKTPESPDSITESFSEVLKKSLEKVNDQQVIADEMTQKLVYDPNSVDAHDVLIAAEKARISLTFTKTIVDGIVKAYKDLSNLR